MNNLTPKPGLASTEFWVVLVVLAIANVFPIITSRFPDSEVLQTVAVVVAGVVDTLVTLGYLVARTSAKNAARKSEGGFGRVSTLLALLVASALILSVLGGCMVDEEWIAASDATYKAVAPEYLDYVKEDPDLSPVQRELREGTIDSWRARIEEWKKTTE